MDKARIVFAKMDDQDARSPHDHTPDDEHMQLSKLARLKRTSVRLTQRAEIVRLTDQG